MNRTLPRALVLGALALSTAACGEPASGLESVGPITHLESPAGDGSAEPNLAVGPDGGVYLSWLEPAAEGGHALRFSALQPDGRWTEPRTIARGDDWFVNWADFPSILPLGGGRLAAHYLQRHPDSEVGYHYDVRIVQSVDGGRTWSEPISPHRDGVPAEHGFVSLFPQGDSVAAVWLDGRKSDPAFGGTHEMTLRYTTIAVDGSLGEEVVLDERICDCCQTSVALTSGGPVAVYRDRTENEIRDIYVTRRVDGEWTEGEPVHEDGWEIAACPVNGPSVSADGERVAVAWFTGARDTARVHVAFSDDAGATFGEPIRVDEGNPAGRVDVELLPGGVAIVSWIERSEGEGAEVRVRRITDAGGVSGAAVVAESTGARASGFPRMVRAGDDVIFAWTEPSEPSRVRVARARLGGAS